MSESVKVNESDSVDIVSAPFSGFSWDIQPSDWVLLLLLTQRNYKCFISSSCVFFFLLQDGRRRLLICFLLTHTAVYFDLHTPSTVLSLSYVDNIMKSRTTLILILILSSSCCCKKSLYDPTVKYERVFEQWKNNCFPAVRQHFNIWRAALTKHLQLRFLLQVEVYFKEN